MTQRNCKKCFHYSVCYAAGGMTERAETCAKYYDAADVVPKSEVERLREINSLLTEAGQEWQKRYENLAREIFEEIENKIRTDISYIEENINHMRDPDAIDGQYETIDTLEWALTSIAELKKKYPEVAE